MPQPKSRAARKAALAGIKPAPKPPTINTEKVNKYDHARDVAHAAFGLKRFEVVVPLTCNQAQAPEPMGPTSVEYGHASAVEDRDNLYHAEHNPKGVRPFDDVLAQMNLEPTA